MDGQNSKHEWRKAEKALYIPKPQAELIEIPEHKFITISGEGNPNSESFSEYISALYPMAYGIKMLPKKGDTIPAGYYDFTVYPLEGIWDINDEAKKTYNGILNKDDLVFKLMIRQPNFVDTAYFEYVQDAIRDKKPYRLLESLKFESITDGRCIQSLHIGPYDNEPISFKKMEAYATKIGVERASKVHREIYLSDFRRTAPEKLKTVLRFKVK